VQLKSALHTFPDAHTYTHSHWRQKDRIHLHTFHKKPMVVLTSSKLFSSKTTFASLTHLMFVCACYFVFVSALAHCFMQNIAHKRTANYIDCLIFITF